jgi:lipid II isoglutaminyl synthase (glutamine-hydrolysing)
VTVRTGDPARTLPARASAAVWAMQATNWLSRSLGRGSGTVAGGRVGLALDPGLLSTLARGRRVALVTGTNGKTTTTRMLVAALSGVGEPVVSNDTGANMPAGHAAALAGSLAESPVVLEVDEGYLGRLVEDTVPRVVVLLNLSRDQLDRISEVRMLVDRWRTALGSLPPGPGPDAPGTVVVANADDPMVTWAALAAPEIRWVGAGQVWHLDAVGCPACGGRIVFAEAGGWACDRCAFARPERTAWLDGSDLVLADGSRFAIELGLPGQFNRANAAMVVVAAPLMVTSTLARWALAATAPIAATPIDPGTVLARVASVDQVAGRFSSTVRHGRPVRLLLAKNPAGWTAIFDLLDEDRTAGGPVVLSINARTADGFDTSWLWDVPFERLAGRSVVATGERYRDLAVRLRYAEVDVAEVADPLGAVDRAATETDQPGATVDFVGNYTAFADLRGRL